MKHVNKITLLLCCFFYSLGASSQHQLQIRTHFDHSFERYTITISDTSNKQLGKYNFYKPDTIIIYTFDSLAAPGYVFVMLSGHSNLSTYFNVSKKVPLRADSSSTVYDLEQFSQKEIRDYKNRMDHPLHPKTEKELGLFNKKSPWMWCVGYTYQKSHLVNLELRKTGMDITGSRSDGQYAMVLFYAPYIILGGDATISPDFQFAPKVGIGFYAIIINANASFVAYNTDFKTFDPAIVPEIGFSMPFGFLHIDYGYNFYLNKSNVFEGNNHKISVKLSWYLRPKKIW